MQTALINGKIYLGEGRFARALLISDGIIQAVGSDEYILDAAAGGCAVVELNSKTVLPGFNDSHMHLLGVAQTLRCVRLQGCTSIEEMIDRCKRYIDDGKPLQGPFIIGRGWNQELFKSERRMPNRFDLDKVSMNIPVIAGRICGHITVCNTKALEYAGITADTHIGGGCIEIGKDHRPNGVLRERAGRLLWDLVPQPSVSEMSDMLRRAMIFASKEGLTSIQTNDIREENEEDVFEAYDRLFKNGEAPLRITQQVRFTKPDRLRAFLNSGVKRGDGTPYHRMGFVKLLIDGSLGARTALMRQPYADDPLTSGVACMDQEQLDLMIGICHEKSMPVGVHAIGDKGIEMVLNSIERADRGAGNPLRHALIHCQITDEALIERIKRMNMLVLAQPVFINSDWKMAEERVGRELEKTSYAFGTMVRHGIHLSYGTDAPVESLRPLDNIHCAVNRTDLKNMPREGYFPKERVSVRQAIDAYTTESAFASGEENVKGKLLPGYYADLTVLGKDIFKIPAEEIKEIGIDMTMVGGKIVYQKERR